MIDLSIKARRVIAQGALTNSKRQTCFVNGVYPTHVVRGQGPYLWDERGRRYIDYICGLGTAHFGYANAEIGATICRQVDNGITMSLSTDIEVRLAEKLNEVAPFAQKWKFYKTGTEACAVAVRIARGYQENHSVAGRFRRLILSDHYHGHSDQFISLTKPGIGVPEDINILPLTGNEYLIASAAAVILEPINLDDTEDNRFYLDGLRKQCTQHGTVLIFDEIITAFRVPRNLVSNYYGIEPDLVIFGKALGAGMPIVAIGGKEQIMDGSDYFASGTFCGETLSIAAALKVIELSQLKYKVDHLWSKAANFQLEFNKLWPTEIKLHGYGTRSVFEGNLEVKGLLWQECVRAGILFGSSFFVSHANVIHLDLILDSVRNILTRIKNREVRLLGKLPESPFSQKQREKSNGQSGANIKA